MISPLPALCYAAKLWEKSGLAMPSFPSWAQLCCPLPGNPLDAKISWLWRMEGEKKTQQPAGCDAARAAWCVLQPRVMRSEPGWLFLNGISRYFHTGSSFILQQNVCEKLGYFISLYQIAHLWANSEWNFGFSGAQKAEAETLADLKSNLSPLLKAWINKAPSNLHLLIRVGKCEQWKLLPPFLPLKRNGQRNPPYKCCICVFWSLLKYLEPLGLWSLAKPIIH